MVFKDNLSLADYSTFRMGGHARHACEVCAISDISQALLFAQEHSVPLKIVGEGSNIIFSDEDKNILLVKMNIKGREIIKETEDSIILRIGAGEIWDTVVSYAVDQGYSGIESLSLIPGTAGATPVQNVGAYGCEIKDTLVGVTVIDIDSRQEKYLTRDDCEFSYRKSIFNTIHKDKYIICSVDLELSKKGKVVPIYSSLIDELKTRNISKPTVQDIREAVIAVRTRKLPNPYREANVGSFFKNPLCLSEKVQSLKNSFPDIVAFSAENTQLMKISAGWLIEHAGLRGQVFQGIEISKNNALVLVNRSSKSFSDLEEVISMIQKSVREKFGIELVPEPEFFL